jgi:hypothetical protein
MAKRAKSPYSVHPGVAMMEDWVATLKAKTGRSLEEWLAYIQKKGPKDEAGRRDWLKKEHGLGTNTAWWLAERATHPAAGEEDTSEGYLKAAEKYVEGQYAGKKAGLRPLYDRLLALGLGIAADAKACPCKAMVPLYRHHVFAQIKPTTNTRIDLGLALAEFPESKIPKRLVDTGGKAKKDRITHRIVIETEKDIDKGVEKWLKTAYDEDAK